MTPFIIGRFYVKFGNCYLWLVSRFGIISLIDNLSHQLYWKLQSTTLVKFSNVANGFKSPLFVYSIDYYLCALSHLLDTILSWNTYQNSFHLNTQILDFFLVLLMGSFRPFMLLYRFNLLSFKILSLQII